MFLVDPTDWRYLTIIAPVGDSNVLQSQRLPQRRIETYPAGIRQVNFSPSGIFDGTEAMLELYQESL
jgi:hypothetical protein